jgi:hypothetical protein
MVKLAFQIYGFEVLHQRFENRMLLKIINNYWTTILLVKKMLGLLHSL